MNAKILIELKYSNSISQANKLDQIAASLARVASSDLGTAIQTVNANWKGENASAYLVKVNNVQVDITKTANDLRKAAAAIRTIARNVYNAEMTAYNIAVSRKY
ncbi:MAG: hypothetical protein K6G61_09900 [Solobacterium sp.]|nr:hypothetical protein [Solobacterium sp.]